MALFSGARRFVCRFLLDHASCLPQLLPQRGDRYLRPPAPIPGTPLDRYAVGRHAIFSHPNWAIGAFGTTYAKSLEGLLNCYSAGIPLFGNTLAGDAFYALLLFGGFALVERIVPAFRSTGPVTSS